MRSIRHRSLEVAEQSVAAHTQDVAQRGHKPWKRPSSSHKPRQRQSAFEDGKLREEQTAGASSIGDAVEQLEAESGSSPTIDDAEDADEAEDADDRGSNPALHVPVERDVLSRGDVGKVGGEGAKTDADGDAAGWGSAGDDCGSDPLWAPGCLPRRGGEGGDRLRDGGPRFGETGAGSRFVGVVGLAPTDAALASSKLGGTSALPESGPDPIRRLSGERLDAPVSAFTAAASTPDAPNMGVRPRKLPAAVGVVSQLNVQAWSRSRVGAHASVTSGGGRSR